MMRVKNIIIRAAELSGVLVILVVVASYALVMMINRFGPGSLLLLASPRTAYTIWLGPRSMDWEGLHIHVNRRFVLGRRGTSVVASRIEQQLAIVGPGVVFVEANRTAASHFASEEAWCASATDRCSVFRPVPVGGQGVCLQYRGTRAKVWTGDIVLFRCRLPSGIEARYGCSVTQCQEYQQVVDDAFATAPLVAAATNAKDSAAR